MIRRLASLLLGVSTLLSACSGANSVPSTASTATPTAAAPIMSGTATSAATPRATASATTSGMPTAPAGYATPFAGYETSCAAGYAWGVQVKAPFVCIDAPRAGAHVARGTQFPISGYAGGSFEHNAVIEVRAASGAVIAKGALHYVAPDAGMPGYWATTYGIPANTPAGPAKVVAHFESPRDGSTVAEASVDIVVD